jgi:hypothetical protein
VNGITSSTSTLNVYPNPSGGNFILNLSSGANEQAIVSITNMVGETVKELKVATNQSSQVNLDEPAGVYFLTATCSTGKYSAKITITK